MTRQKQKGRLRQMKMRRRYEHIPPVEFIFRNWLASARRRLKISIQITGRSGSSLDMKFGGIAPQLNVYLHSWELGVAVIHRQDCWDLIAVNETVPQRRNGGYVCRLCCHRTQKVYSTLGSLWRAHTFEPFLAWVNGTLFPSSWLCLQNHGGATAATLLTDEESPPASNLGALYREVSLDGSIRMSPETGVTVELIPLRMRG